MTGRQSNAIKWFSENEKELSLASFLFVDVCDLGSQQTTLGRSIVNLLLKNEDLVFSFQSSEETNQKLFRLLNNNLNNLRLDGVNQLAIGFPLIQLKNKKGAENQFAPLFVWDIRLDYSSPQSQGWKMMRDNSMPVKINHSLQQYIRKHFKIDLRKLSNPVLDKKSLNAVSLTRICYELSSALGEKEDIFIENIESVLPVGSKNVQCSAVIGNFSNAFYPSEQSIQIKKDLPRLPDFGLVSLDPSQEKAYHYFLQHKHSKVYALPGTGKSHLLNFILINSISKGLNNLVIADSQERIEKVRNVFTAHGLDHLIFEITDPLKDVKNLAQALQYKSPPSKENFDEANFNFLANKCQRLLDRLNIEYSALEKPVFNKTNWSEMVGFYLSYNRLERKELLENQLDSKHFTFHPTEYLSLLEAVKNTQPIYRKINTLKHPLTILHPDLFLEQSCHEVYDWIKKQVDYFHHKFRKLHYRYMIKQQDYAADLVGNYDSFLQDALKRIELIKDQIEDNTFLYGKAFEDNGILQTGKLKVYGVFSNKHKSILIARNKLEEKVKALLSYLNSGPDPGFKAAEQLDSKSIAGIKAFLNELDDSLHIWYNSVIQNLPEELQRLNSKSVNPGLDYAEQINELEYTLDMNVEELNASGLYKVPLQNRMLTIPMRQLFINDVLEQLDLIKNHFSQFEDFYSWQRHWLLLPDVHQHLITGLIKVNPNDWIGAFQSWYFYQRLKVDYHFNIPVDKKCF